MHLLTAHFKYVTHERRTIKQLQNTNTAQHQNNQVLLLMRHAGWRWRLVLNSNGKSGDFQEDLSKKITGNGFYAQLWNNFGEVGQLNQNPVRGNFIQEEMATSVFSVCT